MTDDYVKTVCKSGQKALTCRYLAANEKGWLCAKTQPAVKEYIDDRGIFTMEAQGDNCPIDPEFLNWPNVIGESE